MHLPLPSSLFPPTHVCALHDIARYKPTRFATANYQPPTTSTHVSHQPPTAAQPPTTYCQPLTGSQHNQHPATTSSQSPTTSHRPPATGSQHKQQPPAGVNHKLPNPPDTYPSRKSPLRYLQVPIPPKYVFPNTHQVPSRYLSLPNTSSQSLPTYPSPKYPPGTYRYPSLPNMSSQLPPIPPQNVLPGGTYRYLQVPSRYLAGTYPSPKGPPNHLSLPQASSQPPIPPPRVLATRQPIPPLGRPIPPLGRPIPPLRRTPAAKSAQVPGAPRICHIMVRGVCPIFRGPALVPRIYEGETSEHWDWGGGV